jgi:hypothetical protein
MVLILGTTDILHWIALGLGASLNTVGCLLALLASTAEWQEQPCLQTLPNFPGRIGLGKITALIENH